MSLLPPLFPTQPQSQSDYVSSDGKITRYTNCNSMIEFNGEILPQFEIDQPLTLRNVLVDKINIPFVALGYEISFEQS